jgi:hypothetical protein
MKMGFVIFLILVYLVFCVLAIKKIKASILISNNRKLINIVLCILLPFFWGVLLFIVLGSPTEGSASQKNKNERDSNRGWKEIEAGEG